MDNTFASLLSLMRLTLVNPMEGSRRVLGLVLPREALWQSFVVVVALSVLLGEAAGRLAGVSEGMMGTIGASPFAAAGMQGAFLFIMVHAVHRIGGAFGGLGRFEDSLKLVIWLQLMLIGIQLVQLVFLLLLPPLVPLVFLASVVWFFWMLSSLVMVVHGFENRVKTLLGIVLSFAVIAFVLSFVLAALGIIVIPDGGGNV
jgi:hypothetical protein